MGLIYLLYILLFYNIQIYSIRYITLRMGELAVCYRVMFEALNKRIQGMNRGFNNE